MVRNKEEAEKIFGKNEKIAYIVSDIINYIPQNLEIDYIIHGASPTKSKFFIEKPVETMNISILGTKNILEQAKLSKVKSMVYMSSMEMYGTLNSNNVDEQMPGFYRSVKFQKLYSQGKRTC